MSRKPPRPVRRQTPKWWEKHKTATSILIILVTWFVVVPALLIFGEIEQRRETREAQQQKLAQDNQVQRIFDQIETQFQYRPWVQMRGKNKNIPTLLVPEKSITVSYIGGETPELRRFQLFNKWMRDQYGHEYQLVTVERNEAGTYVLNNTLHPPRRGQLPLEQD